MRDSGELLSLGLRGEYALAAVDMREVFKHYERINQQFLLIYASLIIARIVWWRSIKSG